MKASKELLEYLKKRAESTADAAEKYEPHGDNRIKHIYHLGESSAFKEILSIVEG